MPFAAQRRASRCPSGAAPTMASERKLQRQARCLPHRVPQPGHAACRGNCGGPGGAPRMVNLFASSNHRTGSELVVDFISLALMSSALIARPPEVVPTRQLAIAAPAQRLIFLASNGLICSFPPVRGRLEIHAGSRRRRHPPLICVRYECRSTITVRSARRQWSSGRSTSSSCCRAVGFAIFLSILSRQCAVPGNIPALRRGRAAVLIGTRPRTGRRRANGHLSSCWSAIRAGPH